MSFIKWKPTPQATEDTNPVDFGSSTTDLVVNATNSPYVISGNIDFRDVTVNYGYTLKIERTANLRVNGTLKNYGTITYVEEAGSGTSPGQSAVGDGSAGSGGGGGGATTPGGPSSQQHIANRPQGYGGSAYENFLTTGIISTTAYTATIPYGTGVGSIGAWGNSGSGGNTGGGSPGSRGGALKIMAKVFDHRGSVTCVGGNGGQGGSTGENNNTTRAGGGGGGGGGGSIWVIAEQLKGYGLFDVRGGGGGGGGSVPVDSSNNTTTDAKHGESGGTGGDGCVRLDIGTRAAFSGTVNGTANLTNTASLLINTLTYQAPAGSESATPTYLFSFSGDTALDIRTKTHQSGSMIEASNSTQTLAGDTSTNVLPTYYYYHTITIGANKTLTLGNNVILYCRKLIIEPGGTLENIAVSGGPGAGYGGHGNTANHSHDSPSGGGGAGYATAGTAGGGAGWEDYPPYYHGLGGVTYNNLNSDAVFMRKTDFSGTGYQGSSGGAGGTWSEYWHDPGGEWQTSGNSSGGGGGAGRGFSKIFAWEMEINSSGSWNAAGGRGGDGSSTARDSHYGGGGGGGSGGGINLVVGRLTGGGTIDIRGGSGGWGYTNSGGAGQPGRAYIWVGTNLFTGSVLGNNGTNVVWDVGNLVTALPPDTYAFPSGGLYIYQKIPPGGSPVTINQYSFNNVRYGDTIRVRHAVSERPYNYAVRIYRNEVLEPSWFFETNYSLSSTYSNYLAMHPTGKFIYGVPGSGYSGDLKIFQINQETGTLSLFSSDTTGGSFPFNLECHPSGRFLYVVYRQSQDVHKVRAYLINQTTGSLQLIGSEIQTPSYPSVIRCHPSGQFAYVITKYYSKTIQTYLINQNTGELTSSGSYISYGTWGYSESTDVEDFVFHPSGNFLYARLGLAVRVYSINQSTGVLSVASSVQFSTFISSVKMHPSGNFLYVGTRHDIITLSVNSSDGSLTLNQTFISDTDSYPHVLADVTGRLLYVVKRVRRTIESYLIDISTGALQKVGDTLPYGAAATISENSAEGLVCHPTGNFLYAPASTTTNPSADSIYLYKTYPPGLIGYTVSPFANVWESNGPMEWTNYPVTKFGQYLLTYYSNDYLNNAGENTVGTLSGTVIPPGIPISF